MRLVSKNIRWDASPSEDVEGYYIYYGTGELSYDSPRVDVGNVLEYDLALLPDIQEVEGLFNIWVVAYDEVGNEADPSTAQTMIDFTPPAPAGAIVFF